MLNDSGTRDLEMQSAERLWLVLFDDLMKAEKLRYIRKYLVVTSTEIMLSRVVPL